MNRTIWKFKLHPGLNEISMPAGAEVLHVGADTGEPCLWALVDPDPRVVREDRFFMAVGTGWDTPAVYLKSENYRGTFFTGANVVGRMMGLPAVLVYHVFEAEPGTNIAQLKEIDAKWRGKSAEYD